jgi:hypothetical protein
MTPKNNDGSEVYKLVVRANVPVDGAALLIRKQHPFDTPFAKRRDRAASIDLPGSEA